MKKHVAVLFFIGWFFSMRASVGPGIKATTTVGPFRNQAGCSAYREEIVESLKAVGFQGVVDDCVERKGA